MSESESEVESVTAEEIALAKRNEIRRNLVGNSPIRKSKRVNFFGQEFELRQADLGSILDGADGSSTQKQVADFIINNAYVIDTNVKIFEPTDIDFILNWPFGKEFLELQDVINELMGVDVTKAEEELKSNPLAENS